MNNASDASAPAPTGRALLLTSRLPLRRSLVVTLTTCLAAATALARFELSAFADLNQTVRALKAEGRTLTFGSGDVPTRDVPKAQKILHGGWLADPHYAGEPHWYPFMRPAVAAVLAKATRSDLVLAYHRSDLLLRGACIAAAFLLAFCALGRWGLAWFATCFAGGVLLTYDRSCLYPYQSARCVLFAYLGAVIVLTRRLQARDERGTLLLVASLGAANALLALCHGASFFTASVTSAAVGAYYLWSWWRKRGTWRELARTSAAFMLPFCALISPLLLPQWIRYGELQTADSARLWLEEYYAGGTAVDGLLELRLVPRAWHLSLVALFFVIALVPRARSGFAPLVVAFCSCVALAHLGFVLHDPEHPGLASFAEHALLAPPHTFWDLAQVLMGLMEVFALGWVIASAVRHALAARLTFERRQIGLDALLLAAALALCVQPLAPAELPTASASRALIRFAKRASTLLQGRTVVLNDRNELAWMGDLHVLWYPYRNHTNHYVQNTRREAWRSLQWALAHRDYGRAESLLREYDVGGFIEPEQADLLTRSCHGSVLLTSRNLGLKLRAYDGHCHASR